MACGYALTVAHGATSASDSLPLTVTNAAQARRLAAGADIIPCVLRLEGTLLWVSPAHDKLALQDDSGGVVLKVDRMTMDTPPSRGQRVLLEGSCEAGQGEVGSIGLIHNDGHHPASVRSGKLYLSAGLHPIEVDWFNRLGEFCLDVECEPPGGARGPIPNTALSRREDSGTSPWAQGLNYRAYEGTWESLPNFKRLAVVKSGTVSNFDIAVRTRDPSVGLVFTGYFEAKRPGIYQFWVKSDDGSKLYVDDRSLHLTVLGTETPPVPQRVLPGQLLRQDQEGVWSEMEGTVTVIRGPSSSPSLELTSGTGRTYLKVMEAEPGALDMLLHSRVKATGIYQSAGTVDGQTVPSLLVPGMEGISMAEIASAVWTEYSIRPIASLDSDFPDGVAKTVRIRGTVASKSQVQDQTGHVSVKTRQLLPATGTSIEVLGQLTREDGELVVDGFYREILQQPQEPARGLSLLTTVIQVMNLGRQEALRGYPVNLQGVVTARTPTGFFIQDSTWSIYVGVPGSQSTRLPAIGECWQIDGTSTAAFAPSIWLKSGVYVRPGVLPPPIRPAWDELISGSLSTRYIEIQGVVTKVQPGKLVLLTRGGKLPVSCVDWDTNALIGLDDALIRVCGVGSSDRDENQRMLHGVRLYSGSITVDKPAPLDPFDTPRKRASDLSFFDAHADALSRVKISGQVLRQYHGEYFLMDGASGLRFRPKSHLDLPVGTCVDVVGFPDRNGPSPVLREALACRTGTADLPTPRELTEKEMFSAKLDATLVWAKSRLTGVALQGAEQVLELQMGNRGYVARLQNSNGLLAALEPGSQLRLTGVYAGQSVDRTLGRDVDSFELLLGSPADIQVLQRPSWWTMRHAATVMSGMLFVLIAAFVWITLLRRQVEERSAQLTSEIHSRERAERERVLEEERARIAQDLHDDLGATLTEIRFLSAVRSHDSSVPQAIRSQLSEVSEKVRQLVLSLDEIVWAVNPANDSVPSLASYLRHVAEELFRSTSVRCRLDVDESLPPVPLTSEVRHNLYLCVREALNNAARHAQAEEVWLRIHWRDHTLHVAVEDSGCGFDVSMTFQGNGLPNMRRRLKKIGGRFECDSQPGAGTHCRICIPLNNNGNGYGN